MDNSKDYKYYINKILEDISFILDSIKWKELGDFEDDVFLNNAVCFRFIQISENANKIPISVRQKYSQISWHKVSGLRNRIVHDYGSIQLDIIYNTIINDLPRLAEELKRIT